MKLNAVELLLINNPIRDVFLRGTLGWLHDAACAPTLDRVLEIGCGQGVALAEIAARFHPRAIDAFDLDEAQVARARERLAAVEATGIPVQLWSGDAEQIDSPDARYDAVFEFTIFHHVPNWRRALAEVARVLRPGGLFLFEELSTEFFDDIPLVSPLLRRYTEHPWDTMFDFRTFRRALDDARLRVEHLRSGFLPGWHQGVAVRV